MENKLIGIPGQNRQQKRFNAKEIEKQQKVNQAKQQKEAENQYHIGIRLEFAQKYPLETARMGYEFLKTKPYPEITFWSHALKIHLDKGDPFIMGKIPLKEVQVIYDFLKLSK